MRHTPGPWRLLDEDLRPPPFNHRILHVLGADRKDVVHWMGFDSCERRRKSTLKANAKLIATAPELLAALKAYVAAEEQLARDSFSEWQGDRLVFNDDVWERNDPVGWPLVKQARAAIAKAEGR